MDVVRMICTSAAGEQEMMVYMVVESAVVEKDMVSLC